jgi:hypothetical protein
LPQRSFVDVEGSIAGYFEREEGGRGGRERREGREELEEDERGGGVTSGASTESATLGEGVVSLWAAEAGSGHSAINWFSPKDALLFSIVMRLCQVTLSLRR